MTTCVDAEEYGRGAFLFCGAASLWRVPIIPLVRPLLRRACGLVRTPHPPICLSLAVRVR